MAKVAEPLKFHGHPPPDIGKTGRHKIKTRPRASGRTGQIRVDSPKTMAHYSLRGRDVRPGQTCGAS